MNSGTPEIRIEINGETRVIANQEPLSALIEALGLAAQMTLVRAQRQGAVPCGLGEHPFVGGRSARDFARCRGWLSGRSLHSIKRALPQAPNFPMHLWRKRLPGSHAQSWIDRLQAHVDRTRIALVSTPSAEQSVRLEVYCDRASEARELAARFGGRTTEVQEESWLPPPATAPGRPLSIGGRLLVTSRPEELAPLENSRRGVPLLCIPAAMAFGTGEHATTAMCLRLLAGIARRETPGGWSMLDLGTGSGILALAAVRLGARSAFGLDNDVHAVRTARGNASLNGIGVRPARFARADLSKWQRPSGQTWPVVTANLFSELLIRLMPAVIAPAVSPGGDLILSGVLASQADDVVAAVRYAGLVLVATKSRGRWRAFHCRRVDKTR